MIAEIRVDGTVWQLEHAGDYIGRHLSKGSFYEEDMLQDMRRRVRHAGTAIDAGAHIGNHTVWLAGLCGLAVVAIEPIAETFGYLTRNVIANDLGGRVTLVNRAVSDRPRPLSVAHADPENTGATTLQRGGEAAVHAITIDSMALRDVALLKVDVEGMELDALAGAAETLEAWHPVVYVETNHAARVDQALAGFGYRRFARFSRKNHYGYEVPR
jgi:FkbM family methyltransferase